MAHHARGDDVVLELAQDEHREAGADRDHPARGQPGSDGDRAGGQRPDDRDEFDDPRERADQEPVRLSVEPEGEREQRRDEHHE